MYTLKIGHTHSESMSQLQNTNNMIGMEEVADIDGTPEINYHELFFSYFASFLASLALSRSCVSAIC